MPRYQFNYLYFFMVIVFLSVGIIFVFLPQLDLELSAQFYKNNTFYLNRISIIQIVYHNVQYVSFFGLLMIIIYGLRSDDISNKNLMIFLGYYILVAIVANGLVIDLILKTVWGRARPRDIIEFGGQLMFTPAIYISNQCQANCSFVSGHASAGFLVCATGFIFKPVYLKVLGLSLGVILGLMLGLFRVMQGAHFASDIIFCGLFMLLIIWLLAKVCKL